MNHHAYIYEGSSGLVTDLAADARKRFGFGKEHDPDVHVREFEKFGIEESRWLVETAALKSASGRSIFILGISSITTEAQQALLKLLEEPQEGTIFILLVPHGALLPTVRSRVMEYPEKVQKVAAGPLGSSQRDLHQLPSIFLKASGKERSELITKLLKDDERVKERVREFVNGLEVQLYEKSKARSDLALRQGLADIAKVRDYLRDRSPSLKMLLEHLALSLPTV